MKGRPNNPVAAKAKARAHARRGYYCDCGKVCHGNGGKASHARMHATRGDGHRWINCDDWQGRFADRGPEAR